MVFFQARPVLFTLLAVAIVHSCMLVAGCSIANGFLPQVFLLSVSSTGQTSNGAVSGLTGSAILQIDAGIHGLCVQDGVANQGRWSCNSDVGALVAEFGGLGKDPLGLIGISAAFLKHKPTTSLMCVLKTRPHD
jgi:hypothetical protein